MMTLRFLSQYQSLILLELFVLLLGGAYIVHSDLNSWDTPAHVFSSVYLKEHFFPDFSGWNDTSFGGFPQNYFYPPLFHYLSAGLSFFIPIQWAVKLLVLLSLLLTPFSLYYFSRTMALEKDQAVLATTASTLLLFIPIVYWLADSSLIGGTFESTLLIGLLPNGLALPFFFLALSFICRSFTDGRFFWLAVFFMTACYLTHFIGLVLFWAGFWLCIEHFSAKKMKIWVGILLLSTLLGAFWLFSFFFYLPYSNTLFYGTVFPPFAPVLILAALFLCFFYVIQQKMTSLHWLTVGTAGLFLISLIGNFSFSANRLTVIFLLLSIIVLCARLRTVVLMTWLNRAGLAAIILILFFFPIFTQSNTMFEDFPTDSVALVFTNGSFQEGVHEPVYSQLAAGSTVFNGLFVESSNAGLIINELKAVIDPGTLLWFIRPGMIAQYHESVESNSLLSSQFYWLGISEIYFTNFFSEEKLSVLGTVKPAGFQRIQMARSLFDFLFNPPLFDSRVVRTYQMIELPKAPFAEVVQADINWIDQSFPVFRRAAADWFFSPDIKNHLLALSSEPPLSARPNGSENVRVIDRSSNRFTIMVDSNQPVLVYIRSAYFPNWHAFSNGHPLKVFPAGPGFMMVEAKGLVSFYFEKSPIEQLFGIISLITLAGLVFFGLKIMIERNKSGD